MKIIFCNIAYMQHYAGNPEIDIPKGAGSWVAEHQDAHEKWNFLNVDSYCYGFVQINGDSFHLERIEGGSRRVSAIDGVTVVWCSPNNAGETVVVGWYENATVYREYQESICTPSTGIERLYFTRANADDCYLLPEEARTFTIGRSARDGKGRGFGQSNLWYADSAYAQGELIPAILDFMQTNRRRRINVLSAQFASPETAGSPLSQEETALADNYYNSNRFADFLPYGYREFMYAPSADSAYFIATALCELHQYRAAIDWYNTVIELEGKNWDNSSVLPYLYTQCERSEEALTAARELTLFDEAKEPAIRDELRFIMVDALMCLNRVREAAEHLELILSESDDAETISYAKELHERITQHLG